MQMNMSIIGQPNVTISMFLSLQEEWKIYSSWLANNTQANPGDEMPAKLKRRNAFHALKARLYAEGAEGTALYPL